MQRLLSFFLALAVSQTAAQVRIKDVADIQGAGRLQLVGYGLVVGLAGTGDGPGSAVTLQSTVNLLRNLGLEVDKRQIRLRNVAAVLITADLPAFSKPGFRIDVQVSSMGDARSLTGGMLLMSPLKGPDGEIYAIAQGSVATGGGISQSAGGAAVQVNQSSSALLPGGAIVQKENLAARLDGGALRFTLRQPDFSSAQAMVESIIKEFGIGAAVADDAATVRFLGQDPPQGRASLVARIENLRFSPSITARVVVNERTGTIVAGSEVKLSEVAVTHGSLTVKISPNNSVSQPNALSNGTTQTVSNPTIDAQEAKDDVRVLPAASNVGELARALNALGASPRDLIAILQAIQKSGALQAELVVM